MKKHSLATRKKIAQADKDILEINALINNYIASMKKFNQEIKEAYKNEGQINWVEGMEG